MGFRSNSKFNQNLECSGSKYIQPITTKFCTSHDSVTVVMCAKFHCDRQNVLWSRALQGFHEATQILFKCSTKTTLLKQISETSASKILEKLDGKSHFSNIYIFGWLNCFEKYHMSFNVTCEDRYVGETEWIITFWELVVITFPFNSNAIKTFKITRNIYTKLQAVYPHIFNGELMCLFKRNKNLNDYLVSVKSK